MKTIECEVRQQSIVIGAPFVPVAGSAEIYGASFSFDEAWDGFTRTAVFECGGERREQLLVDDQCSVPWEILRPDGYLRVGVYGVCGTQVMPTVYSESIFVRRGAELSEAAQEHTPSAPEAILAWAEEVIAARSELREISAECETLSAGADATAVYSDGVLSLGIPRGEQGERGETGAQGEPGYTPVRGTDYWTEADRQSVVTDVLAQLPYWTGGSY